MKKVKKVIKRENLPSTIPLFSTLTTYLILDKFNAPEWMWGVLAFIFLLGWINSIYRIVTDEDVDLLNNDSPK